MQSNAGLECGLRWTLGSESPPSFPRWIQLQAISSRAGLRLRDSRPKPQRRGGDQSSRALGPLSAAAVTQVMCGGDAGGHKQRGPSRRGEAGPGSAAPPSTTAHACSGGWRPPPRPGLQLGHAQPRVGPGSAGPPRPPQVHSGALNTPSGRPRPPASPRALGSRGTGPQGARRRPRFSRDGDTGWGGPDVPCPAGSGLGRRPVPCPASGGPRPRHMAAPFKGVGNESLARRARVHGYTPVLTEKGGG